MRDDPAQDHHRHLLHLDGGQGTLAETILDFYRRALAEGGTAIAIARRATRRALVEHFEHTTRVPEVRFLHFDADETLDRFMAGGRPDPARFDQVVGAIVREAAARGQPVAAFGEMVAILWERGEPGAAIELERLWNGLAAQAPFELLCAYSARSLADPAAQAHAQAVRAEHARALVPAADAGLAVAPPA